MVRDTMNLKVAFLMSLRTACGNSDTHIVFYTSYVRNSPNIAVRCFHSSHT